MMKWKVKYEDIVFHKAMQRCQGSIFMVRLYVYLYQLCFWHIDVLRVHDYLQSTLTISAQSKQIIIVTIDLRAILYLFCNYLPWRLYFVSQITFITHFKVELNCSRLASFWL